MTDSNWVGLTETELYRFEADGFLLIAGALAEGEVREARAELAAAAHDAAGYGHGHQASDLLLPEGALQSVTNPLATSPFVLDVALHPGFFPKVRDALAGSVRLLSNEYFITPPCSKPRIGWHRDATEQNFPQVALGSSLLLVNVLVLLSDVGPDNGPTLAVPGSHRWGSERSLPESWLGDPDPAGLPGHVKLCGEAGTVVLFNARLFHSQSENRSSEERQVIVFVYGHRWMRDFPGFMPNPELAVKLSGTPIRDQMLGLGPAFDEPVADYEPPSRWTMPSRIVA